MLEVTQSVKSEGTSPELWIPLSLFYWAELLYACFTRSPTPYPASVALSRCLRKRLCPNTVYKRLSLLNSSGCPSL